MMTLAGVPGRVRGVDAGTVEFWVAQGWVRPARHGAALVFEEIDVARVQLIVELRDELEVPESAIPVVLSLLDQLHASRAEMQRLCQALQSAGDEPVRSVVGRLVGGVGSGEGG